MSYIAIIFQFLRAIPAIMGLIKQWQDHQKAVEKQQREDALEKFKNSGDDNERKKAFDDFVDKL